MSSDGEPKGKEAGAALAAVIAEASERIDAALRTAFGDFTRALLRGVDFRRGGGASALAGLAADAFELATQRKAGEIRVRVHDPASRAGRTAIQIAQDDRPFIVNTLRLVLRRRGLRERLLLHPILRVVRDEQGRIARLGADPGARAESLVCAEVVPRLGDAQALAELESALIGSMETVRSVTDDHRRMIRQVREISANVEYAGRFLDGGPPRAAKICRFLDWLVDESFVFAGFRRYGLRRTASGEMEAWLARGSGLGIFRDDETSRLLEPRRGPEIPEEMRDILEDPRIIQIDKSRLESPLHRAGRLDRVLVKEHDENGQLSGFAVFFGLFSSRALRTPASQIPLLAERLEQVLAEDGALPRSHRWKAIVAAFDSTPLEFLAGSDSDAISALIREIVGTEGTRATRLVLRSDRTARSLYAAVLLPRDRYGEDLRQRVRDFMEERTGAHHIDDRASFIEEGTAILHYFCTGSGARLHFPDPQSLEREIAALCARWEDQFLEALYAHFGETAAPPLAARYEAAFPETLRVLTDPRDGVRDVLALESLHAKGEPQFALYLDRSSPARDTTTLKIYLNDARLLSDLLPVVDHFGIRVVDAQQSHVQPLDRGPAIVETLRVLPLGATQEDLDAIAPRLSAALGAVLSGAVVDDVLNGLVLGAGLDWRQVDAIRAYLEYYMQIQGTLARPYVRSVMLENPLAVRVLVRLFEARFDPSLPDPDRAAREEFLRAVFQGYRDRISALNEDRALSGLHALIEATLRTNFFAPRRSPHRIAFKLDPARLAELAGAQPHREIFVHSATMLGIHLRGGPVARGGLRWSDRADDLRVEILGLMRTQTLKNGLIVPVGAKGGFVLKSPLLSPSEARRRADEEYRVFVSSLLELTDNVDADGRVAPPPGVHRRDGDDPYLVVAADKGTAHLSDAANALASELDYWLGDAFASGGSEGYDHKSYGITARGAWECAKHLLSEAGIDPERDAYTAAGIGDMSGDVFGNGLLLARRARLIAAFDHRHVFLDPDPDPEIAWAERKRLFELPSSSWDDYDRSRISAGGGVFSRSAKRIDLAPAVRARLGLGDGAVTGNDAVQAILALDVDLLWNGGIGTYVKASGETHADAGDRSNDAVRIDASRLRAKVVAEGGNLGLTQAARVEAALAGVLLDTDAIHNSAGVDLSDHEVNYKVMLAPLVRSGRLSREERHRLLFEAGADACQSVLAHNRAQALAISLDELRSRRDPEPFLAAIEFLSAQRDLDAGALRLPDAAALTRRRESGQGLTRPELAVLLGLGKLEARRALAGSALVDLAYFAPLLGAYFPERLRSGHPEAVATHRLQREITALMMASRLLDAGGVTLLPSLVTELGIDLPRAASAALLAEDVLQIQRHRDALLALPAAVDRESIYGALIELDRGVRSVARFLVRSRDDTPDAAAIVRQRDGLDELRAHAGEFLSPGEAARVEEQQRALEQQGLPPELARDVASAQLADRGLNVLRICRETGASPLDAAQVYARIGDAGGINWVYHRLPQATVSDRWDRMVLSDLRWDLLDLQRELTGAVLAARPSDPVAAAEAFLAARRTALDQVLELQRRSLAAVSASTLTVVTQRLRALRERA